MQKPFFHFTSIDFAARAALFCYGAGKYHARRHPEPRKRHPQAPNHFLFLFPNQFCGFTSPFLLRSRQIPCPAPSKAQEPPSPSPESFSFLYPNQFCRLTSPFLLRSCQMPGLASFAPTTHPKNDFIPFRINHQLCRIRNRLQGKIKIIQNTFLNHHQVWRRIIK